VINVCLRDVRVEVLAFNETKEEFVDDLDMRPGHLENRLILFGVKGFALGVHGWRNRTEQVLGKHLDDERIHLLGDDLTVVGNVVEQLVQRQSLDLLGFHVTTRIVEVEDDVALVDLLHEEFFSLVRWHLVESWQLLEVALALIGDIESRRMLALRCPNAFDVVFWCGLQALENIRLGASLGRCKVTWHGFSAAGGRDVLRRWISRHGLLCAGGDTHRCAWADGDVGDEGLPQPVGRARVRGANTTGTGASYALLSTKHLACTCCARCTLTRLQGASCAIRRQLAACIGELCLR
jgi:hypothetical protein